MNCCSLSDIANYLDGEVSFLFSPSKSYQQTTMKPDEVWCHVPPPFNKMHRMEYMTDLGSNPATGGQPLTAYRCAIVFLSPALGTRQAAIAAYRVEGEWKFEPLLREMNLTGGYLVRLDSAACEVLCRIVSIAIEQLSHFESTVEWISDGIHGLIKGHLSSLRSDGPFALFPDYSHSIAWLIASKWEQWESTSTPVDERINFLRTTAGIDLKNIDIFRIQPLALATQLKRGVIDVAPIQFPRPGTKVNNIRNNSLVYPANGFSSGKKLIGWQTQVTQLRLLSSRKQDDFHVSGIWWWQRLFDKALSKAFPNFMDAWEHSAFLYEFRARLYAKNGLPSWSFGRPWCELNRTERFILQCLWEPNSSEDPMQPHHQWRSLPDRLGFIKEVDFAQPLADVLEEVKERWKALEPQLLVLWGTEITSRRKAKERLLKVSRSKLPARWALLEVMDLQHAFGSYTLSREEKITYKRQKENYVRSCAQAGISP